MKIVQSYITAVGNYLYGRHIILKWAKKYLLSISEACNILDVGMGAGADLLNIKNEIESERKSSVNFYGIECYEPYLKKAQEKGITGTSINIEKDTFPYKDEFFDVIIANQIIEHTKEIFWIFSEISRVVKKRGLVIIGVPNIAAWHNRIFFLFGRKPKEITLVGPHVRGFTVGDFISFVELDGYFKVDKIGGSSMYGLPFFLNKIAGILIPSFMNSIFFHIRRTDKTGDFINVLNERFYETPFFRGPEKKTKKK